MKIGKLYKVIKNGHSYPQVGDVVVFVGKLTKNRLITGLNLRTGKRHHYFLENLEEL
tara:strand:- start:246 stop:416 length:171 start_codon:yes stop_codon:yes gene_type:complete